jgi:DNA mismatch repair protein MLH1
MQHGVTMTDVQTSTGASTVDNVRILFGPKLARELLHVTANDETYHFELDAYVSNPNYNMKKSNFILFINRMLLDQMPSTCTTNE